MAVGDSAQIGLNSYIAVGRNTLTSLGYLTATAGLEFLSSSLKITKESKILESVETNRVHSKRIGLGRKVEGDIEWYVNADDKSSNYLIQNALGGAITSATATGETISGLAFTHTYEIGDIAAQSYGSLCINYRKGDSTGQVYEYHGLRVNELTFTAEIDEALKASASFMGKDVTTTTNDVSTAITATVDASPLSFTNGRFSIETTLAALTSTSIWHVQSFEFGISNSLKGEGEARRIGSDTIGILPSGICSFTLNATIRFDTTTAYDAMLAETQLAAQFEFTGSTLGTSTIKRGLKFTMPKVFVMEAGDPEVGGPDEILTSEVSFMVLRDETSATGYALQIESTNVDSAYT